jgi:hypothetical protein
MLQGIKSSGIKCWRESKVQRSNVAGDQKFRDQMLEGIKSSGIKCCRGSKVQRSNVAGIKISGIKCYRGSKVQGSSIRASKGTTYFGDTRSLKLIKRKKTIQDVGYSWLCDK